MFFLSVPSPTLFKFPLLCCLPPIYINKYEPHVYTKISKVDFSKTMLLLLLYRTILLLHCTGSPELPDM